MEIFDYDNVLLLPRKCRVESRSECDAGVELGGRKFRIPVVSAGVSARVNLLGYAVIEAYAARPFQRPGKSWVYGLQLAPGW